MEYAHLASAKGLGFMAMAMAVRLSQGAASPSSRCGAIAAGTQQQQAQWRPRSFGCGLSIGLERHCPSRRRISVSCNASGAVKLRLADAEPISLLDPESLQKVPASQGVYAVYDKEGGLQYIGISGRISASVQGHIRDLAPELCSSVKVATIDDREGLRQAWEAWMREHVDLTGKPPTGNLSGNSSWKKGDLKLKPSPSTPLTAPLEELIHKVVKSNRVVVFMNGSRNSPQCNSSRQMLTLLNEQGLEYETVNVLDEEHNPGVGEAVKVYSQWPTIPQVFVNGEVIGGADVLAELVRIAVDGKVFKFSRPRPKPKPKPKP